jgi:GntR family transcriptional regulator, transcriptional repressor for pyruvate dehydrogenase complex
VISKLNRATLADQAAQTLISYIKDSKLQPGDRLPSETQLASEFGVSRPVIREAFKVLHARGMIETGFGRAATIRPMSSDALSAFFQRAVELEKGVLEMLEVRRGIEVQSAFLAAERRSSKALEQMQETVAYMRDNLKNPAKYADYDVEFHLQVAAASQNKILYFLVESIRESLKEVILVGLKHRASKEEFERVQETHEHILEAFKRKNASAASKAMAAHFDDAVAAISLRAVRKRDKA